MYPESNKILLVDDEPNVLRSLSRLLDKYEVFTADSGDNALMLAETLTFDLVISDYRMPGMNGIDFLILFKRMQPKAIRVVLTGYPDLEAVQHAINEAQVFRFINKPWSNLEIMSVVENGLQHKHMMEENKLLADKVRAQQMLQNKKEGILLALEAEEPGITKVNWNADGAIIIDEMDYE
jgi:response regulator RpfG family c-di-GMP phosphodiesterase